MSHPELVVSDTMQNQRSGAVSEEDAITESTLKRMQSSGATSSETARRKSLYDNENDDDFSAFFPHPPQSSLGGVCIATLLPLAIEWEWMNSENRENSSTSW